MTINRKIEFLQKHVKENFPSWHAIHPENITGFRVGKKIRQGKVTNKLSIIFYVKIKNEKGQVNLESFIPPFLVIVFPDGKSRRIGTDVQEAGEFHLHSGIAGVVRSDWSDGFGSAGLYVKDIAGRLCLVTNYHVVAQSLMARNQFFYQRPDNFPDNNVEVTMPNGLQVAGRIHLGRLSREIDVAFVEMPSGDPSRLNDLQDGTRVRGMVANNPIPPSFRNKPVTIFSVHNPGGIEGTINDNSAVFYTSNPAIVFEDLIQIYPRRTNGGDSGSLVVTPRRDVLALIVGADNFFSYAVPFSKIYAFNQVTIA